MGILYDHTHKFIPYDYRIFIRFVRSPYWGAYGGLGQFLSGNRRHAWPRFFQHYISDAQLGSLQAEKGDTQHVEEAVVFV
jgi:hypothetical protein